MKRAIFALAAAAIVIHATSAVAEVRTREVDYKQGDTTLKGYLAWNDTAKGQRPGVLVVHEWWGHNQHARRQAERLAEAGYVAFALDMFGDGKVTTHPADAQAFVAEATKDPAVVKARFEAALEQLMQAPNVDARRIGAIGYCFGGAVVLGMARAGENLKAVSVFHAPLATDHPAEKGKVRARILVNTGDADSFVPPEQVAAFEKEMKAAKAKYEVIHYPGAKHSFTNPDAGSYGVEQLEYNADAATKSWAATLKMFEKALK